MNKIPFSVTMSSCLDNDPFRGGGLGGGGGWFLPLGGKGVFCIISSFSTGSSEYPRCKPLD